MVKQCFKFLNSFSFRLKNKIVLLIRESHKVAKSVIVLNTIKMVNNPTIGQRFLVCGFPNNNMLTHIAITISSRMVFSKNQSISIMMPCVTTFPPGIAFPPCTYLTVTGNKWFKPEFASRFPDRLEQREKAIDFFLFLAEFPIPKIAIENPIGIMSSIYHKPDQIIQPYQYGHPERKSTCLWLKGLPKLTTTKEVEPNIIRYKTRKGTDDYLHISTMKLPPLERMKARSRTFQGIAQAMAEQWGNPKTNEVTK